MKKIVFMMSGSIACYKACDIISKLVQNKCNVQVLGTLNTLNFIGKSTIEGLTKNPFLTDMFNKSLSDTKHIELSEWADIAIVCPATANIINKMAAGIADDWPSTLFLSWKIKEKPFLVFPAMNENMYTHPITQSSMKKLSDIGVKIFDTEDGFLACGKKGKGRLMDTRKIIDIILNL